MEKSTNLVSQCRYIGFNTKLECVVMQVLQKVSSGSSVVKNVFMME